MAYWWGAVAGAILAIVALGTVVATMITERRDETDALRGIGMSAARQVATRRWELVMVVAAALLVGAVIGVAVSALVVPGLVRSTMIDAPALPPGLTIGGPALWIAAAAVLGAVAGVLAAADHGVRRQAGRPATVTAR